MYLNKYISKCEKWTEHEIKERAEILFERASLIWKNVNNKKNNTDNNFFDFEIKSGKLAKKIFNYLFNEKLIDDELMEKLLSKEDSRKMFKTMNYPIFSYSRDLHINDGKTYRFYKEAYYFGDKKVYLVSQWREKDKTDLFYFYKKYKK